MKPSQKTASQILTEAADLLENNTMKWGQRSYFKYLLLSEQEPSGPDTCCCAHGAIWYCGNSEVQKRVDQKLADAVTLADSGTVVLTVAEFKDYSAFLKVYPSYVRRGEQAKAHFYASKVGCTFNYNDASGRTKEEVIAKLREAANLAALDS